MGQRTNEGWKEGRKEGRKEGGHEGTEGMNEYVGRNECPIGSSNGEAFATMKEVRNAPRTE